MALLEVQQASIDYLSGYRRVRAIERVSFDVIKGECLALIGRSGCGKSTLLKAIGGYIKPSEGRILLNGEPIRRPGPDRMVVWQDFDQLFPWKTIEDNVAYALLKQGVKRADALERAAQWLAVVGLTTAMGRYPHELSGGMKQRVAIARGFAANPQVLLMDEPFSALDALTRLKLQDELLNIQQRFGTTVVFVSHDIEEAAKMGSRVLVLSPHPGQVKATLLGQQPGLLERMRALIFDESAPTSADTHHSAKDNHA